MDNHQELPAGLFIIPRFIKNRKAAVVATYILVTLVLMVAAPSSADTLACHYCGGVITGQYIRNEGKNYHTECYDDHVALRCTLCNELIDEMYYRDFWGNVVHSRHKGEVPQCEYCRRFVSEKISQGSVRYDDGRIVCGICSQNAINDITAAKSIMQSIQEDLKKYGIDVREVTIPIFLVNKNVMTELAGGYHADPLGFTYYEKTTYAGQPIALKTYKIYMLTGLPRCEFIGALAHELMHVWLFVNNVTDIEPALREGGCNVASWLALINHRDRHAEFILENMQADPDPVYGDGYRRMKKYVDQQGVSTWLSYLMNRSAHAR